MKYNIADLPDVSDPAGPNHHLTNEESRAMAEKKYSTGQKMTKRVAESEEKRKLRTTETEELWRLRDTWRDFYQRREFMRQHPELLRDLPPGRNVEILKKRLIEGHMPTALGREYRVSPTRIREIEYTEFIKLQRRIT
jgi:hypothetical protein